MATPLQTHILIPLLITLQHIGAFGETLTMSPVHITVSSLYREPIQGSMLIDRELRIHWQSGIEKVALFLEDPKNDQVSPVLQFNTIKYPEGYHQTNITLGSPVFPAGWALDSTEPPVPGEHCLPFWVIGYAQNQIVHIDCLKIRPTWMQDNRLSIGNLAVPSLFLPGTHNSGCYKRGDSLSQKDTTGRYLLTQDQDLWSQLVYGIRYLDLRIGYYPIRKNGTEVLESNNSFWVNHDLIKVRQLVPLLQQLKTFLARAKDEVVVLDFHRFPVGFSGRQNRHELLVSLLERELKDFAIPYDPNWPSLDNIWEEDKRLVISYGESTIAKGKDWLWPPIKQMWGNQQTLEGLYTFLNSSMKKMSMKENANQMWAAMAHLTPAPLDILFNPSGSLRILADLVSNDLAEWCRTSWWENANIVASDFFLGNDLIDIAVLANVKRGNIARKYIVD